MAERNVAVRLSANVASYMSAMAKASAATKALGASGGDLTKLGGAMQSLGKIATIGVTVPLLGIGAGAVAMAAKFDTAFAQMQGLAGVSAGEIDALKESVLELAGETAVAPQDLAEGLYFLRSSGLDASEAMDALEMSAQASAAGLGSTAVIADAVSSAMNAYAASGLDAAEATDILVATARAGKAEPTELAGALGRVLPIASELGITFEDVGGAIAALSLNGNDASTSATLLTNVMSKLLKPSQQGAAALADVGLSTDAIRQSIAENGLLATLQMLQDRLGDAGFIKFMEDAQAVQGALSLVNDESGNVAAAFGVVADAAGATSEAFGAVSDTAGFKMKQAMTDIKVAMIQVGDLLLPLAADVGSAISGMIGWFSDLSPAAQGVVAAIAGIGAAAGPVLIVAGSLVKNWQAVSTAFAGVNPATQSVVKSLGAVAVIAGTAYAAWQILGQGHLNSSVHINTASGALERETVAAFNSAVAAGEATTAVDALAIAHDALSNAIAAAAEEADSGLVDAMSTLNVSAVEYLDTILAFGGSNMVPFNENVEAIRLAERYFHLASGEGQIFMDVFMQGGVSVEDLANIIGSTVPEVQAFSDALRDVSDYGAENAGEVNDLALTYLDLQAAAGGVARDAVLAAEGIAGGRRETMNAVPVYEEYIRQLTLMDPAAAQAALSTDGMVSSIEELVPGLDGATGAVEGLGEAVMVAASSIDTMSQAQDYLSDLEHTLGEYSSGLDTALGHGGDWVRQHYDMAKAFREFADGITDGDGEIDLLTQGLDANTEAGYNNAQTILDMADGIIAMTDANIMAGRSQEEVTSEYQAARTALINAGVAAGLNRGKVEELIDTYGLVPTLVTTAMQIANDALMKWRIDRYLEKLDEIPEEIASQIEAAIDAGDWNEANRLLNQLAAPRSVPVTPYLTQAQLTVRVNQIINPFHSAAGRFIPGGSNLLTTTAERGGSGGDEVILPLGDPGRMAALLGMSQVGPRVAAALSGLMPYSAPLTSGSVGGGGAGASNVMNVVVNMPPGADGEDVLRALQTLQRRRGTLPLRVAS